MISFLGKFFPIPARPASRREELTELLQESLDDKVSFDSHEGTLLQNFLGLRDTTAADVMVPRADIVSVALADGFDNVIQQMSDANHSRVPVYRDTLDDVAGIIHIKDLFANLRNDQTPEVEHRGDAALEPDSKEDRWFLSDEWSSDNGALIDTTIVASSWDTSLISDLRARGPAMMDHIAALLSLDPQRVSLLLCNDDDMRAMNQIHRGVDTATNVLSFPAADDLWRSGDMPIDEVTIGDIAIAAETVLRESSEMGISAGDHLLHLFTHGVLHLLGYDHEEDRTAAEMEGLEIHLLAQMKIANPYHDDHPVFGMREIE